MSTYNDIEVGKVISTLKVIIDRLGRVLIAVDVSVDKHTVTA